MSFERPDVGACVMQWQTLAELMEVGTTEEDLIFTHFPQFSYNSIKEQKRELMLSSLSRRREELRREMEQQEQGEGEGEGDEEQLDGDEEGDAFDESKGEIDEAVEVAEEMPQIVDENEAQETERTPDAENVDETQNWQRDELSAEL